MSLEVKCLIELCLADIPVLVDVYVVHEVDHVVFLGRNSEGLHSIYKLQVRDVAVAVEVEYFYKGNLLFLNTLVVGDRFSYFGKDLLHTLSVLHRRLSASSRRGWVVILGL